jgi:hypothetical protein
MNIQSRIVVCLIVMIVTVTVQAAPVPGWVEKTTPTSASVTEPAAAFTETWDLQNTFGFAVDVFYDGLTHPLKIVSIEGDDDDSDTPKINLTSITPVLKWSGTDWYSFVPNNGHYIVTFQVVPPTDTDPANVKPPEPDHSTVTVQLDMLFKKDGGAAWSDEYFSTANYTYTVNDVGAIPEPASLVLLGIGAICLRARRKQAA